MHAVDFGKLDAIYIIPEFASRLQGGGCWGGSELAGIVARVTETD